jgi:Na+-driven multidrug efflux pump
VKIDNRPNLAFGALLFSAVVNVLLDWFLIIYLEQGIFGAALATGLSQLTLFIILLPHFFSSQASIRFVNPKGSYKEILKAGNNGASEFVNEASVGITTIIFNYIMIKTFGIDGIAAYTVVSYILWVAIMISFGISDSLQPIISKNFGAKEPERIERFLKYAFISVTVSGVMILSLVLFAPDFLANIFLETKDEKTINIVLNFMFFFWPVFLFNGLNMVMSAYFTAMHKPLPSAIIALCRSFILPVSFILILPLFFGHNGIYLAIPTAEFFTLFLARYLFNRATPKQVIPR